jgi:UDP-N-acetyl-D-glucosamine dehydrogenase
VCVPTPLGPEREPDLGCVEAAALTLARTLRAGVLVVLESTTYPGTTRDVLGGIFAAAGRRPGRDVWLAYSPEREDPGRTDWTTRTTPKLVGGTCARSGVLAEALYGAAVERVHRVERAEVAEAAKLFENVYRAVNIALVNETKLALEAMGLDAWDVLDAAATKPFGFQRFTPGPGMGGHCIPIDPFYLAWAARRAGATTRLVEESGRINTELPGHVVERTRRALQQAGVELAGARVLVLGLAYKAGVDLCFESPSLALLDRFAEAGVREVRWSDPLVASWPGRGASLSLERDVVAGFDAVVLATDQPGFDRAAIAREARLLVDTRNAFGDLLRGDPRYVRA